MSDDAVSPTFAPIRAQSTGHVSVMLLDALDNAWEPLMERCAGLSDAEYLWEPAPIAWTVRPIAGEWTADWADPDPVPAPVTTIAWRCWHIAVDALDSYSGRLFGHGGTGLSGTQWVGSADDAVGLMRSAWTVFREGVAGWGDDVFVPLGDDWGPFANHSRLDLALHANREVIHHGAEIALLRDLYAAGRER